MKRRVWLSLGLVTCSLFVVVSTWLGGDTGELSAGEQRAEETISESADAVGLPAPVSAPDPVRQEPKGSREVVPVEKEPEPVVVVEAPEELKGAVRLFDPKGNELEPASGAFVLIAWVGTSGAHVDIEFHHGAWSVHTSSLKEASEIQIKTITVDEDVFVVELPEGRIPIPEDGFVEVVARQSLDSQLRVFDAGTGVELSGLTVTKSRSFPYDDADHPGNMTIEQALLTEASSPIEITTNLNPGSEATSFTLFVGGPGYAWQPIKLDLERGGERRLDLLPGGDLEVTLIGYEPGSHAELRVRPVPREGRLSAIEVPPNEGRILLQGLPGGDFTAAVELGPHWRNAVVLGSAPVTIRPGELSTVSLSLEEPPVVEYADVSGVLLVPDGWDVTGKRLRMKFLETPLENFRRYQHFELDEPTQQMGEGLQTFAWEFKRMQTGRYELGLREDPSFSIAFEVPARGRDDVRVEVPPVAELSVRILDAVTGDDVVTEELNWNPKRPVGVSGGSLVSAERDPETGLYNLRCPAMEITLMLWDWEYQPFEESIDLTTGVSTHTIQLERAWQIEISLMDGQTAVPFPDGFLGEPEAREGAAGEVLLSGGGDFAKRFQVSAPGRYHVVTTELPGFEPLPDQVIDVVERGVTKHVIELQRR